VKNFVFGLLVGWAAAYWYYAQADHVRDIAWELWSQVSAAPSAQPAKEPALYNPGPSPYPSRP